MGLPFGACAGVGNIPQWNRIGRGLRVKAGGWAIGDGLRIRVSTQTSGAGSPTVVLAAF